MAAEWSFASSSTSRASRSESTSRPRRGRAALSFAGVNDLANWDACGGVDGGLEHASVICSSTTPEEAVVSVMERARQKYPITDWSRWSFRLVEFGQAGAPRVVHFRLDENGRPIRLGE